MEKSPPALVSPVLLGLLHGHGNDAQRTLKTNTRIANTLYCDNASAIYVSWSGAEHAMAATCDMRLGRPCGPNVAPGGPKSKRREEATGSSTPRDPKRS